MPAFGPMYRPAMDMEPPAWAAAGESDRPIPRSRLAIGVAPGLRPRLDVLARGQTLVIGWFTARCCHGPNAIGDLATRWLDLLATPTARRVQGRRRGARSVDA